MALFNGIKIDDTVYDVRIKYETLKRTFELVEGRNSGLSVLYRKIRDLQGVGYSYSMEIEPNPANRQDYDDLYEVLTTAVDSHSVEFPFGQTTLKFDAYIQTGTDIFGGFQNGEAVWTGLSVTFTYIIPLTEKKKETTKLFYFNKLVDMSSDLIPTPIQYFATSSELYGNPIISIDDRNTPMSTARDCYIFMQCNTRTYKVEDVNSILIWVDDKEISKFIDLDPEQKIVKNFDERIYISGTITTFNGEELYPEGYIEKETNSVVIKIDTTGIDPQDYIETISLNFEYEDSTIASQYLLPYINLTFGQNLYFSDDKDIQSIIIGQEKDMLGLSYPVSLLEATIKKQIDESYKNGMWLVLRYGIINNVGHYQKLGVYKLDEINDLGNSHYQLKMLGLEQIAKLQQIADTEIRETFPFDEYNKNPMIENYLTYTVFDEIGKYGNLSIAEAAMELSLSYGGRVDYYISISGELSIEVKLMLVTSYSLRAIYMGMTDPTIEEAEDVDIMNGDSLTQNEEIDGLNVIYYDFEESSEAPEYGQEKSQLILNENIPNNSYTNIKTIDKLTCYTDYGRREKVAYDTFLYSSFSTYKCQILCKNKVYQAGEQITLNTTYGLLKGIIIKTTIDIDAIRTHESIDLLVMKTAQIEQEEE